MLVRLGPSALCVPDTCKDLSCGTQQALLSLPSSSAVRISAARRLSYAMDTVPQPPQDQDSLYTRVAEEFGPPLGRLAAAYELEPFRQQDLLQELHFAIWRSLAGFRGQCSLRTWVYRVAHNAATTYVRRQQRSRRIRSVNIEDLEDLADASDIERAAHGADVLAKVRALIERLRPMDRDVLLLHLEGLTASEIAEVVGITTAYVSQKIHRVQKHLKQHFTERRNS